MQYAMAHDKTECSQEGLHIDITSEAYTFSAANSKFRGDHKVFVNLQDDISPVATEYD